MSRKLINAKVINNDIERARKKLVNMHLAKFEIKKR